MRTWLVPVLTTLLLSACASRSTSPSGVDETGDGAEAGEDAGTTGGTGHPTEPSLWAQRDVDILFVIDNSGSMGEEQAKLVQDFGAFIAVLEDPEYRANYRIAVTTTDNGNPWCGTTNPEGGSLVYSSCLNRIGEFTNQAGTVDASDIACEDVCNLDNADLGINSDSQPWLENIEGVTNIPAGITTTQAFQCIAPQGIAGCGFESQLESMNKALIRSQTQADRAFGFLRDSAMLAVIHVTDEADCSYRNNWASIFEVDGNKVFWHPDSGNSPTSAICWNAGTNCTPVGGNSYDCEPADYDVNGNLLDPEDPNTDDAAVLFPMSRFIDRLQGIENDKKEIIPSQEVIVGLLAGVGADGEPSYADSADAIFNQDFGIGPGCAAPTSGTVPCTSDADCLGVGTQVCGPAGYCLEQQTAIPPVRLAALADHFTENNKFSICADDYTPVLQAIADRIAEQVRPACFPVCVLDTDPTTATLDPQCVVTEWVGSESSDVVECLRDPGTGTYVIDAVTNHYAMPDDSTNLCFAYLVDPDGATPSPLDDLDEECVADGFNLEFEIVRRPGFPAAPGADVRASCELSQSPETDCPAL